MSTPDALSTNLRTITALLQKHDFYYEFSEDMRVFREGFQEKQAILSLMRKLPLSVVHELLTKIPRDIRGDWEMNFMIPDYHLRPQPDPDIPTLPHSKENLP